MNCKTFAASNVLLSEKSNDIFMFVTMRLLSTRVNRNGDAVTAEFINEIVNHQDTYMGLPVYCDTARLLAGDLDGLGHMYNRVTGKFKTTQVGSLSAFEMVEDEYGVSLLAEARFPKRESAICEKVAELYENDALNFSFEIRYMPDAVVEDDGVLYIQADEHNMLTGLAIVSVPAYEEAVALRLVAEDESAQEDVEMPAEQGGNEEMNDNVNPEIVAEVQPVVAEEVIEEAPAQVEETVEAIAETVEAEAEQPAEEEVAHAEAMPMEAPPQDPDIDAAHCAIEAETAQLRAQIAQLEAEIELLRAEHMELEAIRAQRRAEEMAQRQNTARSFAEAQGLDVSAEDVANAIAELNFEKLAELAMQSAAAVEPQMPVEALASASPMNVETVSARDRLFDTDM